MAKAFDSADDLATAALTAAGLGEFEWIGQDGLLIVSDRLAILTGLPVGPMSVGPGEGVLDLVCEEDREAALRSLRDCLIRSDRFEVQFRLAQVAGRRRQWIEASGAVTRGPGGNVERAIGAARDISARRQRDNEQEALVSELDHRVKNVLASVQSLAAQSARRTVSLDGFLKTFLGRVDAMAAAHTLLTATRWRGAEIGNIAAAELAGLAHGQARWGGPEILLSPRATNALTLALHELGTNAVKFGALSTEQGRVDVRWRASPSGGFDLVWAESDGPSVTPPSRYGFGRTLLERVTGRELGGAAVLEFRPEGVRATLTADQTALARSEPDLEAAPAPGASASASETLDRASEGEDGQDDIRGVRVLVVEDAVLLALELEAGLVEAGAKVVGTAASLEEAQRMSTMDFDVAVLDANLNGHSVMPVAHALARRGTPFIFATGYGDAGAAPEGFGAPVVRKPYNIRQIAAALVAALAAR